MIESSNRHLSTRPKFRRRPKVSASIYSAAREGGPRGRSARPSWSCKTPAASASARRCPSKGPPRLCREKAFEVPRLGSSGLPHLVPRIDLRGLLMRFYDRLLDVPALDQHPMHHAADDEGGQHLA